MSKEKRRVKFPYCFLCAVILVSLALFYIYIGVLLSSTSSEYQQLMTSYNILDDQYNDLKEEYETLSGDYDSLKDNYETLNRTYKEYVASKIFSLDPPYIRTTGRRVYIYFTNLDGGYESWSWDAATIESQTFKGSLLRKLTVNQMIYLGLYEWASEFKSGTKYVNLGGNSALDFRPYVKTGNFGPIVKKFHGYHDNDYDRIREVWNMVTQLDTYSSDIGDTPRLPLETLAFGGGDCEDLAILTASILKEMDDDWTVKLVYMDSDNLKDVKNLNHVIVWVETDETKSFIEATNKFVMNPYSEVFGYYLEV